MFLRKGVYPYDCIDEWQQFNEASLTEKEEFYSNLNVEDITDSDYIDAKIDVRLHSGYMDVKNFEIWDLGEYDDLYLKTDTLLLADVFENVRKMCFTIYQQDPANCLSARGLAGQAALKKTQVELEILPDIDTLLMVEKRNTWRICDCINRYAKANSKHLKDSDKNKKIITC